MTDELADSFDRVDRALAKLGRDKLLSRLGAGRTADDVRRGLDSVGLASSDELEALFGWHDGTEADRAILDDIHMFPGFYQLALNDALANYRSFVDDPRWQPGWLPIFANGGGDFCVVDNAGSATGQVRHFRIDEAEHPVEFSSITTLFMTLASCFEEDVFFVDPDGYLEMGDLAFAAVAARIDPGVPWWNE